MACETAWITKPICRENTEIFRVCISYPVTGKAVIDTFYRKLCEAYYGYLTKRCEKGAPPGGSALLRFEMRYESETLLSFSADIVCYEGAVLVDWRRIAQTWLLPRCRMLAPKQFRLRCRKHSGYYLTEEGIVRFHNRFRPELAASMRRSQYRTLVECEPPVPCSPDLPRKPPKLFPKKDVDIQEKEKTHEEPNVS